jgi:hypothetical protein
VTPVTPVTPVQPSPVQEKKKGNGLKIVIIVLVVLLLLCVLCGGGSYFLIQKAATDVQTKVQNEIDKGRTTIKDQIADSVKDSVTDAVESAGSSAASNFFGKGELPVGFPSTVSLASDYEVITGSTDTEGTKKSYTVSYYSAKTIPQLVEIYKTDMVAKGWTLKSSGEFLGVNSVILSKTGADVSVIINSSYSSKETRNMVTVVYQEK